MVTEYTAVSVEPLNGLKLKVKFNENDRIVIYDVHRLIEQYPKYFKQLENNEELFNRARLSAGGYAVIWNSELDVSTYDIWEHGEDLKN